MSRRELLSTALAPAAAPALEAIAAAPALEAAAAVPTLKATGEARRLFGPTVAVYFCEGKGMIDKAELVYYPATRAPMTPDEVDSYFAGSSDLGIVYTDRSQWNFRSHEIVLNPKSKRAREGFMQSLSLIEEALDRKFVPAGFFNEGRNFQFQWDGSASAERVKRRFEKMLCA